jgi:hypothetical protein
MKRLAYPRASRLLQRRYLLTGVALLCSTTPVVAQQSTLKGGGSLIDPTQLPPAMVGVLGALGGRMLTTDKAQIALAGTITDSGGTRSAQILVQAPGYLSYRETQGRAITFDGAQFKTKSGAPSADDERIMESLLAHFPDTVLLQFAAGGGWRRVGSHFRTDDGKATNYKGPYWTIYAFSPSDRPGLVRGQALQQEIFVAIDDQTGRISEVRTAVNTGPKQVTVTQTQFSNWVQQGGQWYPGKIVRLENGKEVLSFQTQQAGVGVSSAAAAFEP